MPAFNSHCPSGRTAGNTGAEDKTIVITRDQSEVGRTTTRWHRSFVETIRSVLIEIVLHSGGETAHADRGKDARRAAHIGQFKAGNVLALRAESIRRAGTCPVASAVVGKIESGLRACHYVIAVVRINPHFAD